MNCEEFEQSVLAEPQNDSDERRKHADDCPQCGRLLGRVMQLERRLSALMAVPVPASIERGTSDMAALDGEQSAGDNVVALRRDGKTRSGLLRPAWLAVAASVALVAVLVVRQAPFDAPSDGALLADAIVEHIEHELGAMRPASTSVGSRKLIEVLSPAGATLADETDLVSYAKSCVINGHLVPHLVMQGENGPVTVLLMPEERVDGPVSIMRDGLEGIILPVGERGSIAIIGRDAASVEAVRRSTRDAVSFRT